MAIQPFMCKEFMNNWLVQVAIRGLARQKQLLVPFVVVSSMPPVLGCLITKQVVVLDLKVTLGALVVVILKNIRYPWYVVPVLRLG